MYRPGLIVRLDFRSDEELQYSQGQPAQPLIFQGGLVSHMVPHDRPGAVGLANKTGRAAMEGPVVCENLAPERGARAYKRPRDWYDGMSTIWRDHGRRSTTLTIVGTPTKMMATVNRQQ